MPAPALAGPHCTGPAALLRRAPRFSTWSAARHCMHDTAEAYGAAGILVDPDGGYLIAAASDISELEELYGYRSLLDSCAGEQLP